MKILITGAAGFVGSYLMEYFSSMGYEVTGLVRKPLEGEEKRYIVCDLVDFTSQEHFDMIIHAAAKFGGENHNIADYVHDNIQGTADLLKYASGTGCKMLYLSTTSSFGTVTREVLSEDSEMNSPGYYGLTKYVAERLVLESTVPSVSFVLPGVVGKKAWNPWLMRITRDLLEHKKIECYDPQAPFNNTIHVHTLAQCIQCVIEHNLFCQERVLVGSSNVLRKYDMLLYLKELLASRSEIEIVKSAANSYSLNLDKAKNMGLPLNTLEGEFTNLAHDFK